MLYIVHQYVLNTDVFEVELIMLGKADLLEAIAGKNRGLIANEQDKQAILIAITKLEEPIPHPVQLKLPICWMATGDLYTPRVELY